MSTIYVCDACKKRISGEIVRPWGSEMLEKFIFCRKCFKSVELYALKKFNIRAGKDNKHE